MKLVVSFYEPLDEISLRRTNTAIKNILNVLDVAGLNSQDRETIRKVILDEINGMRTDMISYFKKTREINGE